MTNQNKNLLKQLLLVIIVLLLCWVFGFVYDFYTYGDLYMFGITFLFFFFPAFVILYLRIKKGKEIKAVNRILRFGLWFSIFLMAAVFGFWFYLDFYWPELGLWGTLGLQFFLFFSTDYWLGEYGILYDIKTYFPHFIIIVLLIWILIINKKMAVEYMHSR